MLDSMAGMRAAGLWPLALVPVLTTCSDEPTSAFGAGTTFAGGVSCDLPTSLIAAGGPGPNGIPALTNPRMVGPDHEFAAYVDDDDRVLGLAMDGEARAYPHNILWWHEIINDEFGGRSIAVTFCPLTGSGIVFDKASMGDPALDVGVSGLLFANNLMMYDRRATRLIGPQMSIVGRCGSFRGVIPETIGVMETTWGQWKSLHPETEVVADLTGHIRDYTEYPYGQYDSLQDESLLFNMSIDRSRPPKELILGIRSDGGGGGIGYPFGELAELGPRGVLNDSVDGRPVAIVFERGEDASEGTAVAFDRRVGGTTLTFERTPEGIRDLETGTTWDLAGRATAGSRGGDRLELVDDAYVSFWFAWRHFEPDSRIFDAPS